MLCLFIQQENQGWCLHHLEWQHRRVAHRGRERFAQRSRYISAGSMGRFGLAQPATLTKSFALTSPGDTPSRVAARRSWRSKIRFAVRQTWQSGRWMMEPLGQTDGNREEDNGQAGPHTTNHESRVHCQGRESPVSPDRPSPMKLNEAPSALVMPSKIGQHHFDV